MNLFSKFEKKKNEEAQAPSIVDGGSLAVVQKLKKPRKRSDVGAIIFCVTVFIYPVLQWLLVYLYCNAESVLQAFQYYESSDQSFHYFKLSEIFTNFERIFDTLSESSGTANIGRYIANGALIYVVGLLILTPVQQFCAFVIAKKMLFYKTMKLLLFLPSILSEMIVILLMRYFFERGAPYWLGNVGIDFPRDFLTNPEYAMTLVMFMRIFLGFGGSIIINTATMGRVPVELVEAGKIDGLKYAGEYCHIYLPVIYPVMVMGMLSIFVGFITYKGPLLSLYGYDDVPESAMTLGHYLYMLQLKATSGSATGEAARYAYGYSAAWSLLIGAISIPIVYATKWMFDRLDPNRD